MGRAKKAATTVLGTTMFAIVAAGVLHMPFARPLLMRIGGCPAAGVSPVAIESARNAALQAARGTTAAPARPALGFTLDGATLADVRAWADRVQAKCDELREGTLIKCVDVSADGVPITEVAFGISPTTKKLVAVTTLRTQLSDADGAAALERLGRELHATLGAPMSSAGAPASLAEPGFHTATFSYAFSDYRASVTATKMPNRGVMLREEYFSIR